MMRARHRSWSVRMEWLLDPQALVGLATLTLLEIVLGIDNIIFISILVGRLPAQERQRARVLGLGAAVVTRLALLLSIAWVMRLTAPLFTVTRLEISGRDLILILGGLFLLWKAVWEIHHALEGDDEALADEGAGAAAGKATFWSTVLQIGIIDIVFSLDSVITAVGLVDEIWVMVTAILIAVGVMIFAVKPIGDFVDTHPTFKLLALSFLVLVGVVLIAEGFDQHLPKGYIYFAMAFAVVMELLNMRMRARRARRAAPVKLHHVMPGQRHQEPPGDA
jgi:predicted tellurium resistance membrane protein TerC